MSMSRLVFAPYDPTRDTEVLQLFKNYNHKNYQLRYMGISKNDMVKYLKDTLGNPNVQTICLRDEECLAGVVSLQPLPWMSKHFGFRMYAVPHLLTYSPVPVVPARLLRYVIEELSDVDFLDCRVAVDDVNSAHALEVCGFRYVGTEIYMGQLIDNYGKPDPHPDFEIGPCELHERSEVLDIVSETHIHNRFAYDPIINSGAAKSLFSKLVESCFDQDNFIVQVARSSSGVHGFIVSKLTPYFSKTVGKCCASLDFIGVRPGSRIKGLGAALNRWALYELGLKGAQYVAVRTLANNYAAMGTCYRTGFRVTSSSLHFHRWIRRPARSMASLKSEGNEYYRMATSIGG